MKFSTSYATALFALSAGITSAFAPSGNARKSSALAAGSLPPAMEWKSYYTNFDDSRVEMTDADSGFDPLEFSVTGSMFAMREAEIKHCRLAMLAAASWPIAELFDKPLANLVGQQPLVDAMDRNPSVLNGGLDQVSPLYWATILVAAGAIDLIQINKANTDPTYTPGDLGFDPLGLYPKDEAGRKKMMAKELRNGRLAMIAVTAFAAQEFVTGSGVIDQTPWFFQPLGGLL